MTNNEWLALIIGALIGIGACGVVFLVGLRIRNAGKDKEREDRKNHKRWDATENIGNRFTNRLRDVVSCLGPFSRLSVDKPVMDFYAYKVTVSKKGGGFPVLRVEVCLLFSEKGKEIRVDLGGKFSYCSTENVSIQKALVDMETYIRSL